MQGAARSLVLLNSSTRQHACTCRDESPGPADNDWLTLAVATSSGILYSYKLEGVAEGNVKAFLEGEWFL